jgi:hypothetical protein
MSFSSKRIININMKLGWISSVITLTMLILGYTMTRLDVDKGLYQPVHIYLGYSYAVLILIHLIFSLGTLGYPWRTILQNPEKALNEWPLTRILQRLSAWLLLLASISMVTTGLGWNELIFWRRIPFTYHVQIDQVITFSLVVHLITGLKSATARNKIDLPIKRRGMFFLSLVLILGTVAIDTSLGKKGIELGDRIVFPTAYTDQNNTRPKLVGKFRLGYKFSGNTKVYSFNPAEVETLRPDIFREGYFSVFDVLAHVAKRGDIDLKYHFDESMNTYVIDSLEGVENWWYEIYFDAGWPESNYYRMDHFPWKDGAYLTFFETRPERVRETLSYFSTEMERIEQNNGEIIIPFVYISGIYDRWQFENVTVTPHNLRSDMFQEGTITAIDVILSLGDQGLVNYTLQWYQSIGEARIVKSYWVEDLMGDRSEGRCGFVHEEGSLIRIDLGGNHIHLPGDIKVLNSPDYAWWFYICV